MNNYSKLIKTTGFLFLLSLIVPILNWVFIFSKFIVSSNSIETAKNIRANDILFRFGIFNEIITSIIIIALALCLYLILKHVNQGLATIALTLRFMEGVIFSVIALSHYIILLILDGKLSSQITTNHVETMAGHLLNMHISITAVGGIFMGVSMMIFTYLLLKSAIISKIISAFGFFSFLLVFIYDSLTILIPKYAAIPIVQIISTAPISIFIILIGFWFIIKGSHIMKEEK